MDAIVHYGGGGVCFRELPEVDVKGINSVLFGASACILLAGSMVFGRQQARELAGIRGLPVERHDIVAGIEIIGTKQLDIHKIREFRERLRSNGADLRLGLPLQTQTPSE